MEDRANAHGALVSISGQLARFCIKLAGLAVLSRMLSDSEVGQYAMILAIIGVASILTDAGLSLAAMQAKSLTDKQSTSLFWVNATIGLVFSLVTYFGAPLLASFYRNPELEMLTQVVAPIFLINSLSVQFRVRLIRESRYLTMAISEVVAPFFGVIVAILGALSGWGTLALLAQELVTAVTLLVILVISARWRPKGGMSLKEIFPFFTFGFATSATQGSNYISSNLPTMIIGAVAGSSAAGQYSRAFQIFMLPVQQLAAPLTRVVVPMLSRSATSDFGRRFNGIQVSLGYLLVVPMALFAIWADPVVLIALGPGWTEAARILEILCIGGCFQAAGYAYYWGFIARGKVAALFYAELAGRGVMVAFLLLAADRGSVAIAYAFGIGLFAVWISTVIVANSQLPIDPLETIAVLARSVFAGFASLIVTGFVTLFVLDLDRGFLASTVATGIYTVIMLALLCIPAMRRDLSLLRRLARSLRIGRAAESIPK